MHRCIVIAACALLLSPVCASHARGWGAVTHRLIAWRAFRAVRGWPMAPDRAARILLDGAVAPDRPGKGHLPSEDHIWHVTALPDGSHRGQGPRAARLIWARILSGGLGDEELLFELGRLCHLVADLHQPLHTGPRPTERAMRGVHPAFEHAVDEEAPWLLAPLATVLPWTGEGIEDVLEKRATDASRWRLEVIRQTAAGTPLEGLRGPVGTELTRSAMLSAQLFAHALGGPVAAPQRAPDSPWLLAVILACIGLGLGPRRPARWPGTRPVGRWISARRTSPAAHTRRS